MAATNQRIALLLADAERLENFDHARGVRLAVRPAHDRHRTRRAVRAELSRDLSQQPNARDHRSRRARRRADPGFRVRRDPAISRRKSGRFGGDAPREQVAVSEWLFWQMSGLADGGQAHHFRLYAPEDPYAIDRCTNEVNHLFGVMNKRLGATNTGDPCSIADMACVGWVKGRKRMARSHRGLPALGAMTRSWRGRRSRRASPSTFPVGERPTSPGRRGAQNSLRPEGAVASRPRAGLAMGAGVGHISGGGVPTRSGDVAERLKAAVC